MAGRLRVLSETYGLASREMALVAVVKRARDSAGELPETRVVPVGMPRGRISTQSFVGFGPRPAFAASLPAPGASAPRFNFEGTVVRPAPPRSAGSGAGPGESTRLISRLSTGPAKETAEDILIEIASRRLSRMKACRMA